MVVHMVKKMQKKKLLEIGTKKISEYEARYLFDSLIKPDVDVLEKSKSRSKGQRNNILTILNNMEASVFDGVYLHYSDKLSEPESEESIAKRIQSTKQRLNEITKKEKKISPEMFERYFGYPNPSYIYKVLNKTENSEENKAQVNIIESRLPNLIEILKSSPTSNVKKKN